jgi:beta-lactamase class A
MMTRRFFAAGLAIPFIPGPQPQALAADDALANIEHQHGGRLGVFAVDTGSGRTMSHRADERFTMCSTFKGILAALILARVDAGQESLDRILHFSSQELAAAGYPNFACPVTAANISQGALTVGTLCQAIVEVSDNLAAILLMRSIGGPAHLTQFTRTLGDTVTRMDRYEPASNSYDGVLDTTSPRAITGSARAILFGNSLSLESKALLKSWMIDSKPGLDRIRASLPPTWIVGDKAGTYGPDETNDYAFVEPPGRAPLLIAAYYHTRTLDADARDAVLRKVGAAFVQWANP